ncbi:MAG: protein-disulfide reductase DsbD domain-containing protein [Roseinatronobacter sp.]
MLTRLLALALCLAQPLVAQSIRPSDIVDVQFRHGWRMDGGAQIAGFHLRLADGWMTYWRHPGESGIAPQVEWSDSDNLADLRVHWPEPKLYIKAGYNSIGYKSQVVFPIELTPRDPAQPVRLRATLSIGVCADICIPVDLHFDQVIEGAGRPDRAISAALDSRPRPARLRDVACDLHPHKKGAMFQVAATLPMMGAREFLLVELPGTPAQPVPSARAQDQLTGQVFLRARDGRVPAIDRSNVLVTVVSENGAVQHRGCSVRR